MRLTRGGRSQTLHSSNSTRWRRSDDLVQGRAVCEGSDPLHSVLLIVHAPLPVAFDDGRGPIGRRRRGGSPCAAFVRLDREVVAGHGRALPIRRRARAGRLPDRKIGSQADGQAVGLPSGPECQCVNRQACSRADRRAAMLPMARGTIARMGRGLPDKQRAANPIRQAVWTCTGFVSVRCSF